MGCDSQHLQEAEGTVEMMLARLAEMNTMLETVRLCLYLLSTANFLYDNGAW